MTTPARAETRLRATEQLKAEFARRLLARLAELGMNQSELARKCGLSRDAVSTYARERSLPGPDVLKKIAKCLDMKAEDLLPTRYAYTPKSPLTLEVLGNGMAHLTADIELPLSMVMNFYQEALAYHASRQSSGAPQAAPATASSKRGR